MPILPSRKSASPSPVCVPSMVNWPGERTFPCDSVLQLAKLPPNAYWWPPRTSVRSSLICQEGVTMFVGVSVPVPSVNPPVTVNSM